MPAIHKAERCMDDLDHPFYNHGARSVCGLFLQRPRIVAEISLDDEAVTCQDCLNAMMYETRETGVPCFRCKERSGLDCAGRAPDESTLCRPCLKERLAKDAKAQAVHLASYLDGLRDGAGDRRVRDVWEKLSDEDRDELWKIIGDTGVDRILSAEPSDRPPDGGQWVNRVHQPLIRARVRLAESLDQFTPTASLVAATTARPCRLAPQPPGCPRPPALGSFRSHCGEPRPEDPVHIRCFPHGQWPPCGRAACAGSWCYSPIAKHIQVGQLGGAANCPTAMLFLSAMSY